MKVEATAKSSYHGGLEEIIRRCEELLSVTPLTFLPQPRASFSKTEKPVQTCTGMSKDETFVGRLGTEWAKNMELLGSLAETEKRAQENAGEDGRIEAKELQMEPSSDEVKSDNLTSGYLPDTEWSRTSGELSSSRQVSSSGVCQGLVKAILGANRNESGLKEAVVTGGSNVSDTVSEAQESSQEPRSASGDDVEIIVESPAKEDAAQSRDGAENIHLKFCPLADKPLRRPQRNENTSKDRLQFKNSNEFFNAISEVMDNLKSYIHLPSDVLDTHATGKERLNKLSKPRTEVYKRLTEVKQIMEAKQLEECSFKPVVRKKSGFKSAPLLDRLAEVQEKKEFRKREARRNLENEELAACSFQPKINHKFSYYDRSPSRSFPERFKELERRRQEQLGKAVQQKDLGYTFKPEINLKSVQLFKERGLEAVDLNDRLAGVAHSVHFDCKHDLELMKATFCPEINSNTDEIIACSKHFGGQTADFFSRQQQFLRALQEKRKQKENEFPLDFTFTPNIGNTDHILRQSALGELATETATERVQRLAYRDKANQMQVRKKAADDYYGQFNFQPAIDEVSRVVGRNSSIRDLYANKRGRELKKELQQAAEEEFRQKYPFRPRVVVSSAKGPGQSPLRSSFLERLQAAKETVPSHLMESRTMKELQEIRECTFKPAVNRSRPKDSPPTIIKGLDRYLELQHIAKQMKKDQENLEKKVFFSHVSGLPIRQYTIPKPFSFTEHSKPETRPRSAAVDDEQ